MQYIILDLEWNQPISYQSQAYRTVGDRLIFEMLQIGAVKLNAAREIVDSISIPIRPTHYIRVHPRIARMTGLNEETLAAAPVFAEAMAQFVDWCGEDFALLTWGCDDVSVLQQNLDFFDVHPKLPPLCDIQHQFSDQRQLKNRMGLSAALELLEIDPDENKSFHNAVNDAYYTALIFQQMPEPEKALNYPQQPRSLIHAPAERQPHGKSGCFDTILQGLHSEMAERPHCAVCGREIAVEGGYVAQSPDKYIALARCKTHGYMLLRMRIRVAPGSKRWMGLNISRATAANVAYVHAKQYQARQRAAAGMLPDPERALMSAARSSVPFED